MVVPGPVNSRVAFSSELEAVEFLVAVEGQAAVRFYLRALILAGCVTADIGDRCRGALQLAGPGAVSAESGWSSWTDLQNLQVPHHDTLCRCAAPTDRHSRQRVLHASRAVSAALEAG